MSIRLLSLVLATTISLGSASQTVIANEDPTATPLSSEGDAVKGKRIFMRCRSCHLLVPTKRKTQGPNLSGLFGREAGTLDGYKYSKALSETNFIWTEEKLDQWLTRPKAFLPGNKMTFMGLKKEKERQDLMAYLRQATVAE